MRLSDTADSFVFMGATLGRQYDEYLRQHDKGYDCDKYFFDCHGVLRNLSIRSSDIRCSCSL
jgi:hypothetical protein